MPKGKGLAKICRFNEEKLEVVPKKKRFNKEKLKVVLKGKNLDKI